MSARDAVLEIPRILYKFAGGDLATGSAITKGRDRQTQQWRFQRDAERKEERGKEEERILRGNEGERTEKFVTKQLLCVRCV